MTKNPSVQYPNHKKNREVARIIAGIYNVTPRYVRMVINGEENNEEIFSAVITYIQGKNNLIEAIKEAVPF